MTPMQSGRVAALQIAVSLLYTYLDKLVPEAQKAVAESREIMVAMMKAVETDPDLKQPSEFIKGMKSVFQHLGAVE